MSLRLKLRYLLLLIAIIVICGYAFFEARGLITGPIIAITSPHSGAVITEPLIHITGTTRRINAISMNGRAIFISEEGTTDEPIALLPGYNEVLFTGTDRFGKTTTVELILMYEPTDSAPVFLPSFSTNTASTTSANATSTEH
jgi:hypothetical protein